MSALLDSETLRSLVKQHSPHQRNRIYTPLVTLGMFLQQVLGADHSCQNAVANNLSLRVAQDLSETSPDTGAYCKARARLGAALLPALSNAVAQRLCKGQVNDWRWRGRDIFLVDGTTVDMPDSEANQAMYPQNKQQKTGLGFPVMRIVGLISLSCGAMMNWVQGACIGKLTGETAMLRELDKALERGNILLMDRCYAGYFCVARLMARGIDFVSRQHQRRKTDFRRGKRLGKRDHVVTWYRPAQPKWMTDQEYEATPESLQVRETRSGEWILITSLSDVKAVSARELNALYTWRWHVELDIRAVKTMMQMEHLRCKTPEMVVKEVGAHFLAYNMVRSTMAQAACQANCPPRTLSFMAAMQHMRAFGQQLWLATSERAIYLADALIRAIAKMKLPHRPGRSEPRAVKRRPKPHALLTQPRAVLKAQLQAQRDINMAGVCA